MGWYGVLGVVVFFVLVNWGPPSTERRESSAASDVYKRHRPVRGSLQNSGPVVFCAVLDVTVVVVKNMTHAKHRFVRAVARQGLANRSSKWRSVNQVLH